MGSISKQSKSVWAQINNDKLNPALVNKTIKLKRWPDFGKSEPALEYLKLSAILSKQNVPVFNISDISGLEADVVNSFINTAHKYELLDITTEFFDHPTDSKQDFMPIGQNHS